MKCRDVKKRHFAQALGNRDHIKNAKHTLHSINEYRSQGAKALHFSRTLPCNSVKPTALAWNRNRKKTASWSSSQWKEPTAVNLAGLHPPVIPTRKGEEKQRSFLASFSSGFGPEPLPPREAEGHKRLSGSLIGFLRNSPGSTLSTSTSHAAAAVPLPVPSSPKPGSTALLASQHRSPYLTPPFPPLLPFTAWLLPLFHSKPLLTLPPQPMQCPNPPRGRSSLLYLCWWWPFFLQHCKRNKMVDSTKICISAKRASTWWMEQARMSPPSSVMF